ncbi:YitT family protein [Paenibacillus sp. FA6]|uniref:YitT family protein n=1 Tax=Paenibacillus sp. FA6 TaxID=3413029 RepID=UPI003F65DEBB
MLSKAFCRYREVYTRRGGFALKLLRTSLKPTESYEVGSFKRWFIHVFFVIVGSVLASVGLELFLIPNQIIVGGVTGISAIFAHITEMRLGLFLFLLNVPFMAMAYRHIRKEFVVLTILGLIIFSLSAILLHPIPALIEHPLWAAMVGGVSLGLGIGIVVRYGGTLDTLELAERSIWRNGVPVSLDNSIMFINCLVLAIAGFIFGWDQAMYSVVAYLLAYEMVHLSIRGFSLYRTTYVQSTRYEEIKLALLLRLSLSNSSKDRLFEDVNHEQDESSPEVRDINGVAKPLVYKVHIAERAQFRALVRSIDPDASITSDSSSFSSDNRS